MKKLHLIVLVFALAGCFALVTPSRTFAWDLFSDQKNGICESSNPSDPTDTGNSAICTDRTGINPLTGDKGNGLLANITNIIATIAGAAAIVVIIIGGIRYITSGGDSGKVSSAKSTVLNALIGLAVIIVARFLIIYIVNKL